MKRKYSIKKIITFIFLFVISFFIYGSLNVNAVELPQIKNYSNWDWNTFSEENKDYWNKMCDGDCPKEYLKQQKKFYNRLYSVLQKYQKKNLYIDDRVLTETIFFGISPGQATVDLDEYQKTISESNTGYVYDESVTDEETNDTSTSIVQKNDDGNVFGSIIDAWFDEDDENEDGDVAGAVEEMGNYYESERDTIKLLVNNMLTIDYHCYREYGKVQSKKVNGQYKEYCLDANGNEVTDGSIVPTQIRKFRRRCAEEVGSGNHVYYEYYLTSLYDLSNRFHFILPFDMIVLGLQYEPKEYNDCMDYDSSAKMSFSYYGSDFKVNYNKYWTFLANNAYFDGKKHLQSYFQPVIDKVKEEKNITVDCMKSNVCDNSLEKQDGLYEEYIEDIVSSREIIIYDIMHELDGYLKDDYTEEELNEILNYEGYNGEALRKAEDDELVRKNFFWPIGSDETEERDGVLYADGDPASTNVIGYQGKMYNNALGEYVEHKGIDIEGVDGVTNVIAVYDGEVISVVSNCEVGDYTCNNNLGNSITIQHKNGDYTIYGHLSSVSVNVGDTVKKGQVIGKVGKTGATIDACLHYEHRIGGNTNEDSINPIDYVDPSDPRPVLVDNTATKSSVCNGLKQRGYSDDAIAGIMVNMGHESGFVSSNVQNGSGGDDPQWDLDYTAKVSSGIISESDFVNNGPNGGGYGLCQWTYPTRKQRLYNAFKASGASSIADMDVQLDYLKTELDGSSTGNVLNNPTYNATYKAWYFCYNFERPQNRESKCGAMEGSSSTYGRSAEANSMLSYVKNNCS